ncbi:SDR family oxidoreductase [Hymenobacter taeanensis]|uniref:SDR family oxidoreductase n=1 Tax=Hymenobacter taeanensis TaxID=2735321 RepID=A0A6M6BM32_9BACT|nr:MULTISPECIES: SDR family oxidoreductase [Hymenobacter]QJX49052.1 SDR family oxidoreductase [Hymenobacter taeanensis]UOQ81429.1 SDR family oxidoreductase [Hymenobacter sp. 5414T-23]
MNTEQNEPRPTNSEINPKPTAYPTSEEGMQEQPDWDMSSYQPAGKLKGKVALITGGDSGIGRAVALAYAMEGADVAVIYQTNAEDAAVVGRAVQAQGRKFLAIQCDVRSADACREAVRQTYAELGGFNILVNNAAYQMGYENFETIPEENIHRTFDTNIKGYIFMAQAAIPFLKEGDSIINTGSIAGIVGNPHQIDYAATKGAIHTFTKSLAAYLGEKKIRVNAVLPGPIWTPLIPGTMLKEDLKKFGDSTMLGRPGQPEELAPAYVYFASQDGSYSTGSLLEVTGGMPKGS